MEKSKTHSWTQTNESVSLQVPVTEGTKGRDVDVKISKSSVTVRVKDRVVCEGTFADAKTVNTVDSVWYIDNGVVTIDLSKSEKSWWERTFQGTYRPSFLSIRRLATSPPFHRTRENDTLSPTSRLHRTIHVLAGEKKVDISKLPPIAGGEGARPKDGGGSMRPIGKLGEQSATRDSFKGKSSFAW